MFVTRIVAVLTVAALLIGVIVKPLAPAQILASASTLAPKPASLATRECSIANSIFAAPFANIEDVLSVSPLGGVTAPGEALPAPYIRINTRKGANHFERRSTEVYSPARADVSAIERRINRNKDGEATGQSWTVHFIACDRVGFQIADIDEINPDLVRRVGGVAAFSPIDGPDHTAIQTQIRVKPGDLIGSARGFDVALTDRRRSAEDLVRPERYETNPYLAARAFNVAPGLIEAIAFDHSHAQCPIDYLPTSMQAEWSGMLGDAYGMRRARGEDTCRTALVDIPDTAQGAWFTDAAHNGVATRLSAIALASDSVDPKRQIFSLHGRLRSLSPALVALPPKQQKAREAAAKDFLSFDARVAGGRSARINRRFAETEPGRIYCYERLRTNFVGPRINGVILFEINDKAAGVGPTQMKMEARGDAQSCIDLPEPWSFTGAETTLFR